MLAVLLIMAKGKTNPPDNLRGATFEQLRKVLLDASYGNADSRDKRLQIQHIISLIEDLNVTFESGKSLLTESIHQPQIELSDQTIVTNNYVLYSLLDNGADPDLGVDREGNNPILISINCKNIEAFKLLLDADAGLEEKTRESDISTGKGWTALMVATVKGYVEFVKEIILRGANIDTQDDIGRTALMIAVGRGALATHRSYSKSTEISEHIVESGANINVSDSSGWSALMYASEIDNIENVTLLLNNSADVNAADIRGRTPLMNAAYWNNIEVVTELLNAGADVNAADSEGWTPLMLAAHENSLHITRLLINKGADPLIINTDGNNAEEIARNRGLDFSPD